MPRYSSPPLFVPLPQQAVADPDHQDAHIEHAHADCLRHIPAAQKAQQGDQERRQGDLAEQSPVLPVKHRADGAAGQVNLRGGKNLQDHVEERLRASGDRQVQGGAELHNGQEDGLQDVREEQLSKTEEDPVFRHAAGHKADAERRREEQDEKNMIAVAE